MNRENPCETIAVVLAVAVVDRAVIPDRPEPTNPVAERVDRPPPPVGLPPIGLPRDDLPPVDNYIIVMTLIIAGDRSGSGKTTVTLALLAALRTKNIAIQSFKVGPDYIDPMFHGRMTDRACYNLDPVLTSETYVQQSFYTRTQQVDYALIEGVMGLFDGAAEPMGFGSTAYIAKLLKIPVLLVVNCQSTSQSIAALIHGYRTFDRQVNIIGVVLNKVGSDRHLALLRDAIEPLEIPILGVMRREDQIELPDRHLGLVPTDELPQLNQIFEQLSGLGIQCFDWPQLLPLLKVDRKASTQANVQPLAVSPVVQGVRIAVARDPAFSFYYADNLELLQALGAELVFWSPMGDEELPEAVQGLYFGGGFPEMFAPTLADNQEVQRSVRRAIAAGMPTYGECGGLMYLCSSIQDFAQQQYPMVGMVPAQAMMGKQLTLGYRNATVQSDTPMLRRGDRIRGHEFHRSSLTVRSMSPLYSLTRLEQLDSEAPIQEGWSSRSFQASYLHLNWGATPELPTRWLKACEDWKKGLT
jgi:cobyrinic acid a,c-diamide synthase